MPDVHPAECPVAIEVDRTGIGSGQCINYPAKSLSLKRKGGSRWLEVLGILVDDYEERRFPIDAPKPVDVIRFRLDQLGLTQSDLSRILGSRSRASEILSEQRSLSLNQIKVLSRELEISADLLLEEPEPAA